jgi:hypothetical protein
MLGFVRLLGDTSKSKVFLAAKWLKVGGSLDIYGTPITSLPKGLKVGGSLNLRGTKITSLPEDLDVKGEIFGFPL